MYFIFGCICFPYVESHIINVVINGLVLASVIDLSNACKQTKHIPAT